jgi:hypothetical protein
LIQPRVLVIATNEWKHADFSMSVSMSMKYSIGSKIELIALLFYINFLCSFRKLTKVYCVLFWDIVFTFIKHFVIFCTM